MESVIDIAFHSENDVNAVETFKEIIVVFVEALKFVEDMRNSIVAEVMGKELNQLDEDVTKNQNELLDKAENFLKLSLDALSNSEQVTFYSIVLGNSYLKAEKIHVLQTQVKNIRERIHNLSGSQR